MPKRKQPETSIEALDLKSHEGKNRDYDKIIMAYKVIGSGNYDDVAKFLQLTDANVVSRRMKEMRDMGLLVRTGVKTKTRRDRNAFVHHLSDKMPKTDKEEKAATNNKPIVDAQPKTVSEPRYIQPELL